MELYPSYVDEMAKSAIDRLTMLEDGEVINFAFMTDIHNCNIYVDRALKSLQEVNKVHPISFVCLGGDYLCNNNRTSREFALSQHKELGAVLDKYTSQMPIYVVKGNHDDNPFGKDTNILHPNEFFDILMKHHAKTFVGDCENEKAMYGYFDIAEHKTRAIFLNVFDPEYINTDTGIDYYQHNSAVISNAQLNWLANKALDLPKDWSIVVFAHSYPKTTPFSNDEEFFGGDALYEIISAYQKGSNYSAKLQRDVYSLDVSVDFTAFGARSVIGYFCGHYHCEWFWKSLGVMAVTLPAAASDNFGSGLAYNGKNYPKTRGSGEESSFGIFRVNKTLRKVDCIICGAGKDFSYNY